MKRVVGGPSASIVIALACGCGGSSSSEGGGSAGLSAGIPQRAASTGTVSYDSTVLGAGSIAGLAVAATGTDTVAVLNPGGSVVVLGGAGTSSAGSLGNNASSLVTAGGVTYAAVGDPSSNGAGDLYRRDAGGGSWSLAHDSQHAELVVAQRGLSGLALAGGAYGSAGTVYVSSGSAGSFASVASIPSAVPTALAESLGTLFVGATSGDVSGSQASLWTVNVTSGEARQVPLPGASDQAGVRQQVTALLPIDTVDGASRGEYVAVAVAAFDQVDGSPVSGSILLTDGGAVELLGSWTGDAPVCLASHESTIFAGTAQGQLLVRDGNGAWVAESLPGSSAGVGALLSRSGQLLVGSGGSVLVRSFVAAPVPQPTNPNPTNPTNPAPAPGPAPTVPATPRFFDPDVRILLQGSCVSCHATAGDPAFAAYPLSRFPDDDASFNETSARIDVNEASNSLLITKALGVAHGGGAIIQSGDLGHQILLGWIAQGARRSANASPFKSYLADIRPLLIKHSCQGCHIGRPFSIGTNEANNYQEVLQFINAGDPAASEFLTRNDGTLNHLGGAAWPAGNAERDVILEWIAGGTLYR